MRVTLTAGALQHINDKGGQVAIDLVSYSTWAGSTIEVSVDTKVSRKRSILDYESIQQNGIKLLVSANLFQNTNHLTLELKQFLFIRRLKASAELLNGVIIGQLADES